MSAISIIDRTGATGLLVFDGGRCVLPKENMLFIGVSNHADVKHSSAVSAAGTRTPASLTGRRQKFLQW